MTLRLLQSPAPGTQRLRFVGDALAFELRRADGAPIPDGWRARLRTNLGRAAALREELITAVETGRPATFSSWRDIAMERQGDGWRIELPLAEVGYFKAKAYALDENGWQHWPDGPDFGVNVQPAWCRTANTIYCAFPRMFGPSKAARATTPSPWDGQIEALDREGFTVIPPSGKLRDLIRELPHIIETLGCRILHLLPINPTPTTYARFGRFGSPYAGQDLLAIDPALVEFDKRTTGVDQFRELTYAVHARGARVFLDMAVNHTGWGSTLHETHPEWFVREQDRFGSPGAWGTVWEDLVELDHRHEALRRVWGEAFVEWCRRGVDGFRCDAGYKVPLPVWQYIIARVRQEFPDTVFLLEGLGGAWADTESLLTEGGMQWAYSELFQNYSGAEVRAYLDYALAQSTQRGLYAHYSETHDNPRLAERGKPWSLLRNRLCALTSVSGAFGFTNGVEWLATERVNVHSSRGLAWNSPDNLVAELSQLNRLLADHPAFFDTAGLTRLSSDEAPIYALLREPPGGQDAVLVLVNTDVAHGHTAHFDPERFTQAGLETRAAGPAPALVDLLGQPPPPRGHDARGRVTFKLPAAGVYCLATTPQPAGASGDAYRRRRSLEAFALQVLSCQLPAEQLGRVDLGRLADWAERDPFGFLAAAASLPPDLAASAVMTHLEHPAPRYPRVVLWQTTDRTRAVPVPPEHWLLVRDEVPFRAALHVSGEPHTTHVSSTPVHGGHVAAFAPHQHSADACLDLVRFAERDRHVSGNLRLLPGAPGELRTDELIASVDDSSIVLLTNGRGGMARLGVNFGAIRSKYDCLLGANLHPEVPVDRHVFAKRARVWVNADGFLSPLNTNNLRRFAPGPPAAWDFLANAGDGRGAALEVHAAMPKGRNTTVLRFHRPPGPPPEGRDLPDTADVRLVVRVDLEDRNFHWETKHNSGADHHFRTHTATLTDRAGFSFTPAPDRQCRVWATGGGYHPGPEWTHNIPHPIEASRGMEGGGDAYSPGWFELPLPKGAEIRLVVCADSSDPTADELAGALAGSEAVASLPGSPVENGAPVELIKDAAPPAAIAPPNSRLGEAVPDPFASALARAASAFVVRRNELKTVIAGYPWFLNWGRDTLICARGLLAAEWRDDVRQILRAFGRFERGGTLPNSIYGEDASNRDTSDAPLWFGVVCEELAAAETSAQAVSSPGGAGEGSPGTAAGSGGNTSLPPHRIVVDDTGRTIADVLLSVATGYLRGTPNGIRVDRASGLVFSPSHFTWMDTNHPAATPREGYPIEIQALWIRLLRQLDRLGLPPVDGPWAELAVRAQASLEQRFWIEELGWYADVLLAPPGRTAAEAVPQNALRSNALLPICLGLVSGERARRTVAAAQRWLVVPGALRSLAPLPVTPSLPVVGKDGRPLNDPVHPYWGRYEGDEDTRRKPAYHNGTAWTWTFPHFGEALAVAWELAPEAVAAARAYLRSAERLLTEGCVGQLPEIVDGDAPHAQRGCDAQAWSVTEALRVWRRLQGMPAH